MIYNVRDFGIKAGEDITVSLQNALRQLAKKDGEKTLLFERGEYYFNASDAYSRRLFITNTVGDKEWKRGEVPHLHRAAIWLENVKDITVDGGGSIFVMSGKMSNAVIIACQNVKLTNLKIIVRNPDMHEFKVLSKGRNHIDFDIDEESQVKKISGKYCFVGDGYVTPLEKFKNTARWIAKIEDRDKDSTWRTAHPLNASFCLKKLDGNKIRAYYLSTSRFAVGDRFYVYDHRRDCCGIAIDRCKDVVLDKISQHFNYGLALVCQDSEGVSLTDSVFAPEDGSGKLIASAADFLHFCSCRGEIAIKNNYFAGAGDDCLNVHGIHFLISKLHADGVSVKFSHPQTHGFNPLRSGDEIAFVDTDTLLESSRAKILEANLENEYTIRLRLDKIEGASVGMAIENKSAIADLDFSHNKMTRIITRGVLVTSGGKIRICDNDFDSTSMHSILISDDAKNWYESGPVSDVEIARNRFGRCIGYTAQVLPENRAHRGAVHKNIHIFDNVIESGDQGGFYFKSADGVVLENNSSSRPLKVESVNSQVIEK